MNTVMVIPTYWARESSVGWQAGDAVYDHPTPLDEDGTLLKAIESLKVLEDRNFVLVVLACATSEHIEDAVEQHVRELLRSAKPPVKTYVISHSHLRGIQAALAKAGRGDLADVLSLRGYSNVRNMCLFVPYMLGADIAVLIDDDELFDDPDFMTKAREFIGNRFMGQTIDAVAGYYVNEKGTYYDDVPDEIHWMTYWDRFGKKREAIDQIIPGEPRLKLTPFAFGGCMVIHRALMRSVPFDPRVPRGEDTDYVINARMFGFDFFLDNQLRIQHRPPAKSHPTWQRLREDMIRLLYDKAKIEGQTLQPHMAMLSAEDFDPYPGEFLKDTLQDKLLKTNLILALDYLTANNVEDAKETIRNIWLAQTQAIPKDNPFETYLVFQQRWRALRELARDKLNQTILEILEAGYIFLQEAKLERQTQKQAFENRYRMENLQLDNIPFFNGMTTDQLELLRGVCRHEVFDAGDVILAESAKQQKIYILIEGLVRVTLSNTIGEDMQLIELGKGEVLGEVSLIIDAPHSASVVALAPTEVITFTRADLLSLMTHSPDLGVRIWQYFAETLATRLQNSNDRYLSLAKEGQDVADELLNHDHSDQAS